MKSALPLTGWDEGLFQESLLGCPVSARASRQSCVCMRCVLVPGRCSAAP